MIPIHLLVPSLLLLLSHLSPTAAILWNATVDDFDPSIRYVGAWNAEPARGDPYFNNTNHYTYTEGLSLTVDFNGTAIYYVGTQNAVRILQSYFLKVVLCSFTSLSNNTQHTLTVTNAGSNKAIDIDYFLVTFDDRSDTFTNTTAFDESQVVRRNVSVDDSLLSNIEYSGSWSFNAANNDFYNSTSHTTSSANAGAKITFSGASAVYYVGTGNADHGLGSCNLSDGRTQGFNSSNPTLIRSQTYCGFQAIDPKAQMSMTVENLADGKFLDVDEFLLTIDYYPPSAVLQDNKSNSSGGGSNTGAIVGAAVGGVVGGLAIIALAIFLYRRRRQYSPARSTDSSFVNSSIPMPPTQPFSPSPFTPPPPGYGHGREEMNEIRNAHQLQASSLPYPGSMPPIQPPPPVDTPSTDGAYGRGSMYGTHGHLGGQYPHEGFGGSPYPSRFPEIQGGNPGS
ncbi:hypothetical protein BT69DRAFT_1292936 [Atractiella rhizophila]|nr:hypothetical protein BT69DRAFT_1292936 [Atractiella rhizophila]